MGNVHKIHKKFVLNCFRYQNLNKNLYPLHFQGSTPSRAVARWCGQSLHNVCSIQRDLEACSLSRMLGSRRLLLRPFLDPKSAFKPPAFKSLLSFHLECVSLEIYIYFKTLRQENLESQISKSRRRMDGQCTQDSQKVCTKQNFNSCYMYSL